MAALRRAASGRTFPPGSTIFAPNKAPEGVFILESGLARIFRVGDSGHEFTLGFIHPGEVFGELSAFDGGSPRESFAEAVESCSVLRIPRGDFVKALRASSSVAFEVATQIGGRFRRIEARVEDLVFRSARSRLARILVQLSDDFGEDRGDGILIDVRLTHEELSKLVGSTRPTVSIAIGELEDGGLITRDHGRFLVLQPDGLRALASEQV